MCTSMAISPVKWVLLSRRNVVEKCSPAANIPCVGANRDYVQCATGKAPRMCGVFERLETVVSSSYWRNGVVPGSGRHGGEAR